MHVAFNLSARPAHPRVGGENGVHEKAPPTDRGSSPRGRGKLVDCNEFAGLAGLIPAWAGKTLPEPPWCRPGPAHPRVGGENTT